MLSTVVSLVLKVWPVWVFAVLMAVGKKLEDTYTLFFNGVHRPPRNILRG